MMDICYKCDVNRKIDYVFFDTGLEYDATKEHLSYLEKKYNIKIERHRAKMPIPISCKTYGQPFISKYVSQQIDSLQRHGFQWEDKPLEELLDKYSGCKTALKWWSNYGEMRTYKISNHRWLREFLIENPPLFPISDKCCKYAKKDVSHSLLKERQYDLLITGIRQSEGGIRAVQYQNCYTIKSDGASSYRPLFWYINDDKEEYEKHFNITHSKCYTLYGFLRTGCVCCPFGKGVERELNIIKTYEPKKYVAVNSIFKDSYEYTRKYREFAAKKKQEEKENKRLKKQNNIATSTDEEYEDRNN